MKKIVHQVGYVQVSYQDARSTEHKTDIAVGAEWSLSEPQESQRPFDADFSMSLAVRGILLHRQVSGSAGGQNHGRGLEFEAGSSHYQEDSDPKTHRFEDLKSWAVQL